MAEESPRAEGLEILDERIDFLLGTARSAKPATADPSEGVPESRPAAERTRSDDGRLQPIFVLSCHRSGSTLLRFILDTHPEIYCPPELFLGQAAHSLAIFLCGLEGADSYGEAEGKIHVTDSIAETLRSFIADRLSAHTARRGKRFWCEKTPQNLLHLQLLDILFPQAKYLCLHRHCLDVVASALPLAGRISGIQKYIVKSSGHFLTGAIRWWCELTRSSLELERRHPERCFRLRYEDLVADPRGVLAPLFEFLGVSWEEGLLESVFSSQHDRGYEDPNIRFTGKIHAESVGYGSRLSLEGVADEAMAEMRELLSELGYPESLAPPAKQGGEEAADFAPWFFESFLPERLAAMPDLAAAIDRSFRFAVDGLGGGTWVVDLRPGGSRVLREGGDSECTVMISAADLANLSRGGLNPRKAFMERRLRLTGSVDLATLESLTKILTQPAAS